MSNFQTLISVEALQPLLARPRTRVVDCRFSLLEPARGHEDYLEGHIPGAVYADLDRDLAGEPGELDGRHPLPDAGDFASTLRRWGIGNESQVVAYDDANGAFAARLWWMLRWLGHDAVAVLDGGYAAWHGAGKPVEQRAPSHAPGNFVERLDDGMQIGIEELRARLASDAAYRLIDAREAGRFRGEHEPIDTVAGHVPGAANLPLGESLDADGRWRSADALRRIWGDAAPRVAERGWAVMCGSGVSACHLALSAAVAGHPEPRLFVGSWSQWIRDPDRPVVAGGD